MFRCLRFESDFHFHIPKVSLKSDFKILRLHISFFFFFFPNNIFAIQTIFFILSLNIFVNATILWVYVFATCLAIFRIVSVNSNRRIWPPATGFSVWIILLWPSLHLANSLPLMVIEKEIPFNCNVLWKFIDFSMDPRESSFRDGRWRRRTYFFFIPLRISRQNRALLPCRDGQEIHLSRDQMAGYSDWVVAISDVSLGLILTVAIMVLIKWRLWSSRAITSVFFGMSFSTKSSPIGMRFVPASSV